jgi:hypothetical protein
MLSLSKHLYHAVKDTRTVRHRCFDKLSMTGFYYFLLAQATPTPLPASDVPNPASPLPYPYLKT